MAHNGRIHLPCRYWQCTRCTDVFMTVGNTPIQLSRPMPVTMKFGEKLEGICPRHPRKGVAQDA